MKLIQVFSKEMILRLYFNMSKFIIMVLTGKARRNSFEVLLSGARKLSLQEPHALDGGIANNKRLLYNKFLEMLQKACLGFTQCNFEQQDETLIQTITNCMKFLCSFPV